MSLLTLNRGDTRKKATITIASSTTVSDAVEYKDNVSGGFIIPSAFTGTTVTFLVSDGEGTYQALQNATGSAAVSVTVGVSKSYPLPVELLGFPYFKFVSGTAEAANRVIYVTRKR